MHYDTYGLKNWLDHIPPTHNQVNTREIKLSLRYTAIMTNLRLNIFFN